MGNIIYSGICNLGCSSYLEGELFDSVIWNKEVWIWNKELWNW